MHIKSVVTAGYIWRHMAIGKNQTSSVKGDTFTIYNGMTKGYRICYAF